MLNENHNQNGVLECRSDGVGGEESPMFTVRNVGGGGRNENVQSPWSRVQSPAAAGEEGAEFEEVRLKMIFRSEGWVALGRTVLFCVGGRAMDKRQRFFPDWQCALQVRAELRSSSCESKGPNTECRKEKGCRASSLELR